MIHASDLKIHAFDLKIHASDLKIRLLNSTIQLMPEEVQTKKSLYNHLLYKLDFILLCYRNSLLSY